MIYHYTPTLPPFFHLLGVGLFNSLPPSSTIDNLLLVEMLVGPIISLAVRLNIIKQDAKLEILESKLSAARGQGVM